MQKISYGKMIETGLLTLINEQSFTRMELWKVVHHKFPEANYVYFLPALKKIEQKQNDIVRLNNRSLKVSQTFMEKQKKKRKKPIDNNRPSVREMLQLSSENEQI
jgi:hypothetical protein